MTDMSMGSLGTFDLARKIILLLSSPGFQSSTKNLVLARRQAGSFYESSVQLDWYIALHCGVV